MTPQSNVVWLASYPKSGNTWVRTLLQALRTDSEPDLNALDSSGTHDRMDLRLGAPLGDLADAEVAAMLRLSWAMASTSHGPGGHPAEVLRKTHHGWLPGGDGYPIPWQPEGARAIYVVRDPRAVLASWAHHRGHSFQQTVEVMRTSQSLTRGDLSGGVGAPSWTEHVRSWLDDCPLPLLLVRYEDLLADGVSELRRISDFLDVEASDESIARAVERCSFMNLAAQEIVEGFREAASRDRAFFRRGTADAWREEVPTELADAICRDHGATMDRLGYL